MAWERLAHVALSGSGDVLDSGTFTAKKSMRIIIHTIATGGNIKENITFNSDTGNNYARRRSNDGASDSTDTSQPQLEVRGDEANDRYITMDITNISDKEKLVISDYNINTDGAGNAPSRSEWVGKWANTSAQITKITVTNTGSGSYDTGSYITVLGAKEAATSDTITVSDLTAKKHLMIQTKILTTNGNTKPAMRFNNDSGNNYATRDSDGGGTDATETTVSEIRLSQDSHGGTVGVFASNINVINEASKEKLIIADTVRANATGAGTAPDRYEIVSKWANTSNAITRVDIINEGTGDFPEGSEVTVYGTD